MMSIRGLDKKAGSRLVKELCISGLLRGLQRCGSCYFSCPLSAALESTLCCHFPPDHSNLSNPSNPRNSRQHIFMTLVVFSGVEFSLVVSIWFLWSSGSPHFFHFGYQWSCPQLYNCYGNAGFRAVSNNHGNNTGTWFPHVMWLMHKEEHFFFFAILTAAALLAREVRKISNYHGRS